MISAESKDRPVVGLGQASIDFLGQISEYPDQDTKCELLNLTIQGGGPTATALVTLSRLGISTAFIGVVGEDDFGTNIREGLIREGVDVSRLRHVPGGRSQAAFITIDKNTAARTIFWHKGDKHELELEQADRELIGRARLLHLDGLKLDASLQAADLAGEHGIPVVFDAGTLREGYIDLAQKTDYLICSDRFLTEYQGGEDPQPGLEKLWALGPRHVVVTRGERGSWGYDGRDFYHQPAFPVQAVDTTGAGDVYHGAYIYGIIENWDMPRCMGFASAASALKCRRIGGRTGIPTLDELNEFLKSVR